MIQFFLGIYDKLSARRWVPASIFIVLMLLFAMFASRMDYQEDISAFLPENPQTEEFTAVYTKLGGQDRIAVIFSGDSSQIIPAMDYFGEKLTESDTLGMVRDLQVTIDETQMLDIMGYVWQTYPLMLSDTDLQRIDSLVASPEYVAQQMEANRQLLMLPFGSVMTDALPFDPLHLSAPITQGLQNNQISNHYQIIDGHIFSKDENSGIVLLSSPYGISESHQNEKLANLLDNVGDSVMAQYKDVKVSSIGAPVIAVGNASQIKKDSIWAVSLSVILIFIVLIYSFRRWSDIVWIGISILFGWVVALGSVALFNHSISIIVLGIGSVIIGIAVNYPLHFLGHMRHEPNRRNVLKEMVPPLLIGNITTVSAFLCLVFIDADAMCDLGVFGSLMLIGTIAFVLILLPSLVKKRKQGGKVHVIIPDINITVPKIVKRLTLPVMIVLTIVLGYFSLGTSFDSNMQHINYMTSDQREDLKLLSTSIEANDSTATVFAVSKGNSLDDALAGNEKLLPLLQKDSRIYGISGVGNLILSSDKRNERLQKWNELWQRHPDVIEAVKENATKSGFIPEAFTPFYDLCEGDVAVDGENPLMNLIGRNYILKEDDGTVRVVNILKVDKDKTADVKESLRADIEKSGANAFIFDSADVSSSLVSVLSDSFNYIGFVCGFVVFAFLWLSFGSIELCLISFIPLAVSWLWILGIMDICSIQFNIVNIILATFIFGQGDDYSIFITEGLIYEYAYGRKRMKSYKNSVALSAVLMFIGIGTLIFAKHPALFSLAEVAIVGMIMVVVMTFYLPPLIFRWITTKKGVVREVPLTMKRLLGSAWALSFFIFWSLLVFVPYAFIQRIFLSRSESCKLFFHKVLRRVAKFVIYRVPGVKCQFINAVNEDFERPSVIICNHQSHLDIMCMLMMHHKIVLLTNDWVWHNPFYGQIIRAAEFYPVSDGMDSNMQRLEKLVERGYSVMVFPEGTRALKRDIMRFHKGAFVLARRLNVDILPIMIHGLVDVLPKRDFMLREGQITVEVHKRMSVDEFAKYSDRELTSYWHKWYVENYREMSQRLEDVNYCIPYVRYKYKYKGVGVERRCNKMLKMCAANPSIIEQYKTQDGRIVIPDSGQGEIAWLASLTHPECEVYAYEADEDLYAIAQNTQGKPANLHFINEKYTS